VGESEGEGQLNKSKDPALKTKLELRVPEVDDLSVTGSVLTQLNAAVEPLILGVREIPIVRVTFPHRYELKIRLLGREFVAFSLCGESEVISENNDTGD